MYPQYGELRPISGWDRSVSLGHPCKFERVMHLGSVTARHSSSGRQPNFAALNKGRHLYSAGRPSRWALAHILVPDEPILEENFWGKWHRFVWTVYYSCDPFICVKALKKTQRKIFAEPHPVLFHQMTPDRRSPSYFCRFSSPSTHGICMLHYTGY